MCATPPKHILPPAPTVNFPTVTPNTIFIPVPTSSSTTTTTSSTWLVHRDAAELAANGRYAIADRLLDFMRGLLVIIRTSLAERGVKLVTKLVMVLEQQTTEIASTAGGQVQPLDIDEELLPLQDLPQLCRLEQMMQQSPDYKQKLVRIFFSFFNNCLHNYTDTESVTFFSK